ncbi:WD repeat-containing protein 55 [Euphorbia peplus]|nr:WD repeat-containing protein 55 [Euphorbia peplus]
MEIDVGVAEETIPFGLDFHPNDHLVAAALISGDLQLYRYAGGDAAALPQRLFELKAHTGSCRAVRFINNGQALLTGSTDCSILAVDLETGSPIARVENAHEESVYSMVNITESTIATGDEKGFIKVWDTRQRTCCNSFKPHDEYVSDMTIPSDSMKLLATSGDGTLSVCNLRSNKVQTRSEFSEEELSSVVVMKNGRKVICGSQDGTLLLYSWGFFKDCSDRFVGLSPNPVNALLKLDEERVIAASANGLISVVGILPNRIIQPLADHSSDIEGLAFSHDRKFLGSIGHDFMLKLWDLDELLQEPKDDENAESDNDSDEMEVDVNPPKSKKGSKRKPGPSNSSASNFFADL